MEAIKRQLILLEALRSIEMAFSKQGVSAAACAGRFLGARGDVE